jgi:CheY-like chemotaxis protein
MGVRPGWKIGPAGFAAAPFDHYSWGINRASAPTAARAVAATLPLSFMSVRTVLVIDDDPGVRETLQVALTDQGYHVLEAADGETGISSALRDSPDLIICDMMMPRVSGFMVVERLKSNHRLTVPIIMLTANESPDQRTYAEFLGVDSYLLKPVRPQQLFHTVNLLCPPPKPVPSYGAP